MSKIFDKIEVSQEVRNFVDRSMEISDQIFTVLQKKGLTQREFAKLLDKKESEVSKWLTGMHNFTIKSIAKMEAVLGESIVTTPQKAEEKAVAKTRFVKVSVSANINRNETISAEGFQSADSWVLTKRTIYDNGIKVA